MDCRVTTFVKFCLYSSSSSEVCKELKRNFNNAFHRRVSKTHFAEVLEKMCQWSSETEKTNLKREATRACLPFFFSLSLFLALSLTYILAPTLAHASTSTHTHTNKSTLAPTHKNFWYSLLQHFTFKFSLSHCTSIFLTRSCALNEKWSQIWKLQS